MVVPRLGPSFAAPSGKMLAALSGLLLLGVGFFYLLSGLVAPGYAVIFLLLVWGVLSWLLVRVARVSPLLSLLVPPLAFGLWMGILALGGRLFGWTA